MKNKILLCPLSRSECSEVSNFNVFSEFNPKNSYCVSHHEFVSLDAKFIVSPRICVSHHEFDCPTTHSLILPRRWLSHREITKFITKLVFHQEIACSTTNFCLSRNDLRLSPRKSMSHRDHTCFTAIALFLNLLSYPDFIFQNYFIN